MDWYREVDRSEWTLHKSLLVQEGVRKNCPNAITLTQSLWALRNFHKNASFSLQRRLFWLVEGLHLLLNLLKGSINSPLFPKLPDQSWESLRKIALMPFQSVRESQTPTSFQTPFTCHHPRSSSNQVHLCSFSLSIKEEGREALKPCKRCWREMVRLLRNLHRNRVVWYWPRKFMQNSYRLPTEVDRQLTARISIHMRTLRTFQPT